VLVVHGNHSTEDCSDPGYDYLGELLASRGIILASVDENFINGTFSARVDLTADRPGLKEQKDARHGANWLPNTYFINQFSDSNENIVVDFENDLELSSLDIKGGTIEAKNLSRWYEVANELKKDKLDTHSVVIAWDKRVSSETASITFGLGQTVSGNLLVASLSSAGIASTHQIGTMVCRKTQSRLHQTTSMKMLMKMKQKTCR